MLTKRWIDFISYYLLKKKEIVDMYSQHKWVQCSTLQLGRDISIQTLTKSNFYWRLVSSVASHKSVEFQCNLWCSVSTLGKSHESLWVPWIACKNGVSHLTPSKLLLPTAVLCLWAAWRCAHRCRKAEKGLTWQRMDNWTFRMQLRLPIGGGKKRLLIVFLFKWKKKHYNSPALHYKHAERNSALFLQLDHNHSSCIYMEYNNLLIIIFKFNQNSISLM